MHKQKLIRLIKFATAAAVLSCSLNAHAGVVLNYGGLDWLSLTETQGASAANALAANTGYRHATLGEVGNMWLGEFSITAGIGFSPSNAGATSLINTFGCTAACTTASGAEGTLRISYGILDDGGGVGSPFGTSFVKERKSIPDGIASYGLASLAGGNASYGHYLVKASSNNVPEPGTLSLLGLSLLGLSFIRRRRVI